MRGGVWGGRGGGAGGAGWRGAGRYGGGEGVAAFVEVFEEGVYVGAVVLGEGDAACGLFLGVVRGFARVAGWEVMLGRVVSVVDCLKLWEVALVDAYYHVCPQRCGEKVALRTHDEAMRVYF